MLFFAIGELFQQSLSKSNHSPNIYTILLLLLRSMKLVVNRKKMTTSDEVTTFSINLFCLIFSLFDKSRFISIQWDDYFQTSLVGGRIVENFIL